MELDHKLKEEHARLLQKLEKGIKEEKAKEGDSIWKKKERMSQLIKNKNGELINCKRENMERMFPLSSTL